MTKRNFKLGTIVHICNPRTKETKIWRVYLIFLFLLLYYFKWSNIFLFTLIWSKEYYTQKQNHILH